MNNSMASNSPGSDEKQRKNMSVDEKNIKRQKISSSDTAGGHRARAGARASLSDKVGFFEQVFGAQGSEQARTNERPGNDRLTNQSRVGAGYHGPRADARDRSSEDPRRHRIPRASLSPPGDRGGALVTNQRPGHEAVTNQRPGLEAVTNQRPGHEAVTNQRPRSRSASRGRDTMGDYSLGARGVRERLVTNQRPGTVTNQRPVSRERSGYSPGVRGVRERLEEDMMTRRSDHHHDHDTRVSLTRDTRDSLTRDTRDTPSDDIPSSPYRSISIKRTQSGRAVDSVTRDTRDSSYRTEFKPRALSFRVSPTKSQDDNQDDVHQPLQPIFTRVTPSRDSLTRDTRDSLSRDTRDSLTRDTRDSLTRDTRDSLTRDRRDSLTRDPSMSITQHIQAKVSRESLYQKPPPLPERPPRQHQRQNRLSPSGAKDLFLADTRSTEASLYSSPRVSFKESV